jgi:NAD(P)-dependent dehydrogenase (short-subunit alcohol dehydrogenase family)
MVAIVRGGGPGIGAACARTLARRPEVVRAVEKRHGCLDVMVANAGIGIRSAIIDMAFTAWRRQRAVNLEGVFLSVKHAVPAMRRAGGGSIVIMSSLAGLRGAAGLAGHSATKGGVACSRRPRHQAC